jgi:N-acetylmuramoyl-L-alanine amidase
VSKQTKVFVASAMLGTVILADASPWTEKHEAAVVRIEVPLQGAPTPQVATGFIITGAEQRYYVVTASHGIVATVVPEPSPECMPLPTGMKMSLRRKNGQEVIGKCVVHIGNDTALIELQPPQSPLTYPRLELNARTPKRHELLYYGGFPFKIEFIVARKAEVSANDWPPEGWTATEANPAKGMSGGPYLEAKGTVVGLHHGQASDASGWGFFVPVSLLKTSLEKFVRPVVVGPDPDAVAVAPGPNCSASSVAKVFRHVHPSQRVAIYNTLCHPADPQVSALLPHLEYEPPQQLIAAAAPPSSFSGVFSLPSLSAPSLPATPSAPDPQEVTARVKRELKLSETTCLEESNVTVVFDLLNCHNRGQFLPSPNVGGTNTPALVVMHSTYTTSAQAAIGVLTSTTFQASAHVLIERDGSFVQLVPFNRAAWHAGPGKWEGMTGLNNKSIGLELINAGKLTKMDDGKFKALNGAIIPDSEVQIVNGQAWHKYTAEQIAATVAIGKALAKTYKISAVVGHCDLAPGIKADPGPAFPTGQIEAYVLNIPDRRAGCPGS